MQRHKPIILHLPGLLIERLEQRLQDSPPSWSFKIDYFYYLIRHMTTLEIQWKNRKYEYYPVNINKLRAVTVSTINRYLKYLVDGELLLRDNYIPGEKSYHYRLNPALLKSVRTIRLEPGSMLFQRIIHAERNKRKHIHRQKPHLKQMRELFMKIDIDYPAATRWIEEQGESTKKYVYYTMLDKLRDNRFRYFDKNSTNGRLDTNLTVLKKELRGFMIGDWVSIDLANSQPLILSQVLDVLFSGISDPLTKYSLNNNKNTPPPHNNHYIPLCSHFFEEDLVKYFGKQTLNGVAKILHNGGSSVHGELFGFQISCVNGSFYEDFIDQFGDINGATLTRDDVKDLIFPVLFSRNEIYRDWERKMPYQSEKMKFAQVYPIISSVIQELKRKDHARLAILLQKIESKIFIDSICPLLVNKGIVPLTIHDSIIVNVEQEEGALEACKNVFKDRFNVIPTFHVKPLEKVGYGESGTNSISGSSLTGVLERKEQGMNHRLSA